jgi:hypothetical protein
MLHPTIKKAALLSVLAMAAVVHIGCDEDDGAPSGPSGSSFTSLESPYLICAGRNPGGVGFDFEYQGEEGGADNLDALQVADFDWDLKVITTKGEKPGGDHQGMPRIQLAADAEAVNYSAVDPSCKGVTRFNDLTAGDIGSPTYQSDDPSFDPSGLPVGGTLGLPTVEAMQQEYQKLVIGDKWKGPAKNDVAEDELIWIVKTSEGRLVKLIVDDFPAADAPTPTGYISLIWGFLE